jgi:hypothetical protein
LTVLKASRGGPLQPEWGEAPMTGDLEGEGYLGNSLRRLIRGVRI